MASKEVEKEIDNWVKNNPSVRGKYPMSNRRRIMNTKYYDVLWRQQLREVSWEMEIDKSIQAFS